MEMLFKTCDLSSYQNPNYFPCDPAIVKQHARSFQELHGLPDAALYQQGTPWYSLSSQNFTRATSTTSGWAWSMMQSAGCQVSAGMSSWVFPVLVQLSFVL